MSLPLSRLALALTTAAGLALAPVTTPAAVLNESAALDESAVGEHMGEMNDAKRAMRKALEAEDTAAALTALTAFQAAVVGAKAEVPPRAESMEGDARAEFVSGYRGALSELLRASCDLEAALLAGRGDEAAGILRDTFKQMQDSGHERYEDEHEDH